MLSFLLVFALWAYAQTDIAGKLRDAWRKGNVCMLTFYLNESVELNIAGQKATYNKQRATARLKQFFKQYKPVGFEYLHKGSAKEGLQYMIGNYQHKDGSFSVYMLLKHRDDTYVIEVITITGHL